MNTSRPNILFLFTDDQRFDTIGALGNRQIHTPNLDALVASGVAFEQAYIMGGSCPAVCMPSRAMLHTSRSLYHIEGLGREIPPEHVTLGEHLRANGYQTFGTGKWHNGTAAYARSFTDGAEIFFGGMHDHWNVPACHFDPTGRYELQRPMCLDAWRSNAVSNIVSDHTHPGRHSTDLFADAAKEFLRTRQGEKPFFMYVSFMAPHDPRTMPREFLDLYNPEDIELPANFMEEHPFDNGELVIRDEKLEAWPRTEPAIRRHLAEYYAMISHLDHAIGDILQALKETGQYDNTIIVLAGDNGLALGQHGLMGKQNLYDHSVHVPLIMAGPGIQQGEKSDAMCYLIDIAPTLCEQVGIEAPDTFEGQSLLPVLQGRSESLRDGLLFAYKDVQRAVRDDRYKLVEYVVNGKRTTQLFDLADDPYELNNLADEPAFRQTLEGLRLRLQGWRNDYGDTQKHGQRFWAGFDSITS